MNSQVHDHKNFGLTVIPLTVCVIYMAVFWILKSSHHHQYDCFLTVDLVVIVRCHNDTCCLYPNEDVLFGILKASHFSIWRFLRTGLGCQTNIRHFAFVIFICHFIRQFVFLIFIRHMYLSCSSVIFIFHLNLSFEFEFVIFVRHIHPSYIFVIFMRRINLSY